MYDHVINEITMDDDQIVEQAVEAAVEEVRSYLSQRYNTDKIFEATGSSRNALVMENVKTITVWNIIKLCNAETIYEIWKERYDRVIAYLRDVAKGLIAPSLPPKIDEDGDVVLKMRFGSNRKFSHGNE